MGVVRSDFISKEVWILSNLEKATILAIAKIVVGNYTSSSQ